jgi:hypothetical protein
LDVKFRTGELKSNCVLWREGMASWQQAFKIDEIKQLIQSSADDLQLTKQD